MEKTAIEEIEDMMSAATVKRSLSEAVGAEDVAVNYYELEPGETFGFGYHRHPDQEELFHILSGTATFETEEGAVAVHEGEMIRFAPGEWQLGHNRGDKRVRALAIGAPQESETDLRRECPDCGTTRRLSFAVTDDGEALAAYCETCGTEVVRHS